MLNISSYNVIKVLTSISFVVIAFQGLSHGVLTGIVLLMPYVIVFLLANESSYKTTLRIYCRVIAGILVSLISLGLLFGISNDPQVGIGVLFAVAIQYGILFVSEALIGLYTYGERNT